MPVIRPLPEDVASRIAAGEVIERPASVLKELVENSLDAGAAKISVEVKGAGRKLLRVSDDGRGMAPEDCRIAFRRHTTSKISTLKDLETLKSFGFRGEALFSISAVSKTVLTSTPRGKRKGWRVEMRGGKLAGEHEAAPSPGTTLEVCDLFFNTPARAKFLKSDPTERSHLARVIEEAALANPEVAFVYKSEGRTIADYPARKAGKAGLRSRVAEVLGEECGRDLLYTEREAADLTLCAFLSPAETLHSSRGLQYVFVNRRPVTNRTVSQALYRAYEPFRGKNRHPATVIYLRLSPANLDVNVHPTKREVRFRPNSTVYQIVSQALSKSLLESKNIPTIGTPTTDRTLTRGSIIEPHGERMRSAILQPTLVADRPVGEERAWFSDSTRYLGQIERSYLVFEMEGGLVIVDQHAAQEKILFERYMKKIEAGNLETQKLMLPLPIDLPPSGIEKILAKRKRLRRAGFEIEAYGKTTLHILSTPAIFSKAKDIKDMVHGLLDSLLSPSSAAADARYDATATIACKASVKAHDSLSEREALALLEDLRRCSDGTCCPHGRPTMLRLDRGELARRFGRPGPPPLHA